MDVYVCVLVCPCVVVAVVNDVVVVFACKQ